MPSVAPQVSASDVSSLNTVAANFLEYVDQNGVFDLIWEEARTLTIMAKKSDIGGQYYDHSVRYGASQGNSASGNYGAALGNQTAGLQATFHVPMCPIFHTATIENQAIEQSRNKKGAFLELADAELKSGMKEAANLFSRVLLAAGTATLGQIAAIQVNPPNAPAGSARVRLTNPLAYFFFETNMTCDSTVVDGGAPSGAPDYVKVIQVDAAAEILVFGPPSTGAWNAGYWIPGAYVIRDGDYNSQGFGAEISTADGVTPFNPMNFAGMGAWNPSFAFRDNPGLAASQFFNVNRSRNGTRLAGISIDGTGEDNVKALIRATVQAARFGKGAEYCTINTDSYNAILNQLQGQKLYLDKTDDEIDGGIVYKDVVVFQGGARPCKLIPESWCPAKTGYLWSPDDYMMVSVGGVARPLLNVNGQVFTPLQNQWGCQFSTGGYGNLVAKNPRNLVNVAFQQ